jgi:DNA ligase-1
MVALQVETADGKRFQIGTGFTDAVRDKPPAIGTSVTYTYRGLTNSGLPRFASYLRVRDPF